MTDIGYLEYDITENNPSKLLFAEHLDYKREYIIRLGLFVDCTGSFILVSIFNVKVSQDGVGFQHGS